MGLSFRWLSLFLMLSFYLWISYLIYLFHPAGGSENFGV